MLDSCSLNVLSIKPFFALLFLDQELVSSAVLIPYFCLALLYNIYESLYLEYLLLHYLQLFFD